MGTKEVWSVTSTVLTWKVPLHDKFLHSEGSLSTLSLKSVVNDDSATTKIGLPVHMVGYTSLDSYTTSLRYGWLGGVFPSTSIPSTRLWILKDPKYLFTRKDYKKFQRFTTINKSLHSVHFGFLYTGSNLNSKEIDVEPRLTSDFF